MAILFGRNRASEDIDVVCEPIPFDHFSSLWDTLTSTFECIITSDRQYAYEGYLLQHSAIRFAYPGEFIPNIEFKFAYTDLHKRAMSEKIDVVMSDMAPNVIGSWDIDEYRQIELARIALKLAKKLLKADGWLVVKIFQGREITITLRR